MTARVSEAEVRFRPVLGQFLGKSWLTPRNAVWGAGVSVAVLFVALLVVFRPKPLPRRAAEGAAPPARANARIASAQDKLKADPQDIAALMDLGTALFEKGKDSYVEALSVLEEARSLGALDPRVFYCLGVMYQDEGLYPFALDEYKKYLRHYPDDKEVRLLAAKLYFKMGLFPEAVNEFERLKFASPEDSLIEENLGLSLWNAKQMDRARASFELLLGRGGDFARRASFYLGRLALEAGDHSAAAERFLAAADGGELSGVPPEQLHAGLGASLQKLGRFEEAKTAWENALKAVPGDAKAAAALREVNRRLAAARKATEAAERAAKKAADAKARAERLAAEKAAQKK